MSTEVLEQKLVGETVSVRLNFLSRLEVGETLATSNATVSVFAGVDAAPTAMLSGASAISGTEVVQKLVGGLPGVIYKVTAVIRTSLNNILMNEAKVAVLTSAIVTPP